MLWSTISYGIGLPGSVMPFGFPKIYKTNPIRLGSWFTIDGLKRDAITESKSPLLKQTVQGRSFNRWNSQSPI